VQRTIVQMTPRPASAFRSSAIAALPFELLVWSAVTGSSTFRVDFKRLVCSGLGMA
jgi:hypothetical protein